MKYKKTKVITAVITAIMFFSLVSFASDLYDSGKIGGYDFADIYINNRLSLNKDQGYTRVSDGALIPSSLNWDGTTYVPLRAISEMLGAEVGWDGSILIDLAVADSTDTGSGFTRRQLNQLNLTYKTNMTFNIKGGKTAFVEDSDGDIVENLNIDVDSSAGITISNAYMLGIKEDFVLKVLKDDEIVEQPFYMEGISLDSFEESHGKWYTVVPADEDAGFYHPMIIGFGKRTENIERDFNALGNTLLVEGSNEGVTYNNEDSYSKQINERFPGEISVITAERNELPFMVSMFPRPRQDGLLYTHALDRDTLFNSRSYFNNLGRGNLYRLDEQFLSMIDYTQDIFNSLGLDLDEEVGIAGFSASSDWANRMTMLHPDRFKFVVANLTATMPMTSYEGHDLPYPLGLSNISSITGDGFDAETYQKIPMFWFVGAEDYGDGTTYDDGWGNYGNYNLDWNQEGIDYRLIFGEDPIARRELQMEIIYNLGFNQIEYVVYPGLAHGWGDDQLEDIDDFIQQVIE